MLCCPVEWTVQSCLSLAGSGKFSFLNCDPVLNWFQSLAMSAKRNILSQQVGRWWQMSSITFSVAILGKVLRLQWKRRTVTRQPQNSMSNAFICVYNFYQWSRNCTGFGFIHSKFKHTHPPEVLKVQPFTCWCSSHLLLTECTFQEKIYYLENNGKC